MSETAERQREAEQLHQPNSLQETPSLQTKDRGTAQKFSKLAVVWMLISVLCHCSKIFFFLLTMMLCFSYSKSDGNENATVVELF